jgi:sulfide:quinone oxidoreductase
MTSKVLILGGGFGGITAAIELAEVADVTLIDRELDYYMGLAKLWVATGRRSARGCYRPRDRLKAHGVEFVQAEVQSIDAGDKSVTSSAGRHGYDHLVIALGLGVDPSVVPGLAENGLNLYSMEGAEAVARALPDATGDILIVVCAVPFKCPPAPYEAAMMINSSVDGRARIEVVTPEPRPMPILPPEAGERVIELLAERAIAFTPGHKMVSAEAGVVRFENGAERRFDLLVAVPPHRPPAFLAEIPGLTDASGLITVDRETLATDLPGIYAVGDVAKVLSYTDMPIPRAGVLAEAQARVVAANISALIGGEAPSARFDGRGYCFVEVGGGKALRADGEFLAKPGPLAHLSGQPSEGGLAQKAAFESDRLDAWFGRQ